MFRDRDRRPVAYAEGDAGVHAVSLAGGVLARPAGEGIRQGQGNLRATQLLAPHRRLHRTNRL